MKNDIKKKFIDILFEPDDDEDEGYEIPQPKKPVPKQESTVSAKDLLYKKSGQSAFINLDEKKTKKESSEPETEYGDYEFSSQISPIFGMIKENKPSLTPNKKNVNETLVNKPDHSHLEIITSPIYGYGSREDYEKDHFDLSQMMDNTDDEELHRLLDDDYGYDDHTYDDIDDSDDDEITLFGSYEDE